MMEFSVFRGPFSAASTPISANKPHLKTLAEI